MSCPVITGRAGIYFYACFFFLQSFAIVIKPNNLFVNDFLNWSRFILPHLCATKF